MPLETSSETPKPGVLLQCRGKYAHECRRQRRKTQPAEQEVCGNSSKAPQPPQIFFTPSIEPLDEHGMPEEGLDDSGSEVDDDNAGYFSATEGPAELHEASSDIHEPRAAVRSNDWDSADEGSLDERNLSWSPPESPSLMVSLAGVPNPRGSPRADPNNPYAVSPLLKVKQTRGTKRKKLPSSPKCKMIGMPGSPDTSPKAKLAGMGARQPATPKGLQPVGEGELEEMLKRVQGEIGEWKVYHREHTGQQPTALQQRNQASRPQRHSPTHAPSPIYSPDDIEPQGTPLVQAKRERGNRSPALKGVESRGLDFRNM